MNAASKTIYTEKTPAPFINQLKLDDFYCWYEINVYTKNEAKLPAIYTDLYKNIQNGFSEKGISMFAPHFQVQKRVDAI
jgi:small-conductance mechanosensitive channel